SAERHLCVHLQFRDRELQVRRDRRWHLHYLHQRRCEVLPDAAGLLRLPVRLPRLRLHVLRHAEQHADLLRHVRLVARCKAGVCESRTRLTQEVKSGAESVDSAPLWFLMESDCSAGSGEEASPDEATFPLVTTHASPRRFSRVRSSRSICTTTPSWTTIV